MEFDCPIDDNMLFATGTFAKLARDYGKSTKDMREAVRKSTTVFIHYILDYAAQQHQGNDDQRTVMVKPADIIKAIDELGFTGVSKKLRQKK